MVWPASAAVAYSNVGNLTVEGGSGSDTFLVSPGNTTTISIVGGRQRRQPSPGDRLSLNLARHQRDISTWRAVRVVSRVSSPSVTRSQSPSRKSRRFRRTRHLPLRVRRLRRVRRPLSQRSTCLPFSNFRRGPVGDHKLHARPRATIVQGFGRTADDVRQLRRPCICVDRSTLI